MIDRDRALIERMKAVLAISPQMADYLTQHWAQTAALLSAARQARTQGPEEGLTPEEAWQDLLEKDDRTSPEDYPDMALITADELQAYMLAARDEGRAEGLGGEWRPEVAFAVRTLATRLSRRAPAAARLVRLMEGAA